MRQSFMKTMGFMNVRQSFMKTMGFMNVRQRFMKTMGFMTMATASILTGNCIGAQIAGSPELSLVYKGANALSETTHEVVKDIKDRIQVAEERKEYNLDPSLSYEQARIKLDYIHIVEACRKYGIEKPAEHDLLGHIIAIGKIRDAQLKEVSDKLKEFRNDLK